MRIGALALGLGVVVLGAVSMMGASLFAGADARAEVAEPEEPPTPMAPLSSVPVPGPANIGDFIRDRDAAIALGKALFWDMQVGSDGTSACASCHFNAGADPRSKNNLNPGRDGLWELASGPNAQVSSSDFPTTRYDGSGDFSESNVVFDTDDVMGSQGVTLTEHGAIAPGASVDLDFPIPDGVFSVHGLNTRRTTGRNSPPAINAVFNFRNFWDGRAQNEFNGVNPFGSRDRNARVVRADNPNSPNIVKIQLKDSSLASQAVGPPLSNVEMSSDGRAFRHLGRKILSLTPLARQEVAKTDSVLGPYVTHGGRGLKLSYAELIEKAFQPRWWYAPNAVIKPGADGQANIQIRPGGIILSGEYRLAEWNFSMLFGLAVQEYERTLVSDRTPVDLFLEGNGSLTDEELAGMEVFNNKGKCINCHGGAELTNASVASVRNQPLETMLMGNEEIATYDNGFYNIGVRRTSDDLGLGRTDPWGKPLSMAGLARDFGIIPNNATPDNIPAPGSRIAVDGAFKTSSLRNVELTAPYFHNGGQETLEQVVDFYDRGGDFSHQNIADLDPEIGPLGLFPEEKAALVAFLKALTDERVRNQSEPFDHPQLCVPNGHATPVVEDPFGAARTSWMTIPATGAGGGDPIPAFLEPVTPGGLDCERPGVAGDVDDAVTNGGAVWSVPAPGGGSIVGTLPLPEGHGGGSPAAGGSTPPGSPPPYGGTAPSGTVSSTPVPPSTTSVTLGGGYGTVTIKDGVVGFGTFVPDGDAEVTGVVASPELLGRKPGASAPGAPAGSGGGTSKARVITHADCTVVGTTRGDVLRGTRGADVICGLGGNDVLIGGAGRDRLVGGAGRDAMFGGSGGDLFEARDGKADRLDGGDGADRYVVDRTRDRF